MKVPFNRATITGNEIEYISKALEAESIGGDGKYALDLQKLLESKLEISKVLLTPSCTHAIEMCAILLNIHSGDEVIVPSFTFASTALAFVMHGAIPVFADIRKDTLNINETTLENIITPNTKAIVPVHYAGVSCDMDTINEIANYHNITVIEDNAHGLFSKYKNNYLGSLGSLAVQSFHETKNFTCGEGGALLINDIKHIQRAEIIRDKGTDRSKFIKGMIDKYTWIDKGSSYLMSDICAAMLYAQLLLADEIQMKRKNIWEFYYQNLKEWSDDNDVKLPIIPALCEQSFHMFYLIMPTNKIRDSFIQFLKENEISAVFHYLPLHASDMGIKYGKNINNCPVTEDISGRIVRLPFYTDLETHILKYIIEKIHEYKIN